MKISALLLFFSASVLGADYYVSSSGSDANAGTQSSPIRTLWKANALPLVAGDRVLLKKGDTWREILRPRPGVYYGAYGEGQPPILHGGTLVDQWQIEGDHLRLDYNGETTAITEDGLILPYASDATLADGAWHLTKAGAVTIIRYRPTPGLHTVERFSRHAAIDASNATGSTVEGFDMIGAGVYAAAPIDGFKVRRCRLTRGGIWIGARNGMPVRNVEVSDNMLVNANEGIFIGSNSNGLEIIENAQILRNVIINTGYLSGPISWRVSKFLDREAIGIQNMRGTRIVGNYITGGAQGGGVVTWTNNQITAQLTGNIIDRNIISSIEGPGIGPGGAGFAHSNANVTGNIVSGTVGGNLRLNREQLWQSEITRNVVYGDVFFNSFPAHYSVYKNEIKGAIRGDSNASSVYENRIYQ